MSTELFERLAAPFPPASIHWRAQTVKRDGTSAMALAYIDARDVMARLDEAVGPANWQDRYEETAKGRVICTIAIKLDGEWVEKSDGAGESDIEGEKGALSGAFKRAAVKWGVGRYLYDMPTPWAECESYEVEDRGKKRFKWKAWKPEGLRKLETVAAGAVGRSSEPDNRLQIMLDKIEACDTQLVLQRWWKDNEAAVPDAYRDKVVEAINKRKAAIETMDRSAA